MFLAHLASSCISISTIFAATLPQPLLKESSLSARQILPRQLVYPRNSSLNISSLDNNLRLICNAAVYGQNLRVNSCREIFRLIVRGEDQKTFGERGTYAPHQVPLPYRLQSEPPVDGRCFIQVVLKPGPASGHMSTTQLGQAAYNLFDVCVIRRGYGGIASNPGGDNNLQIVIASYKPNVRCDTSHIHGPPWESCVNIFTDMRADKIPLVFGRRGPGVQERLPLHLKSVDARCSVKIDTATAASSTSTWFELWEAVNSIAYMCLRQNEKGGKATIVGSSGNIMLELKDDFPSIDSSIITAPNVSAVNENLLSVTSEAQNFSTVATSLTLLHGVPLKTANIDVQESSPTVLVASHGTRAQVGTS